MHLQQPKRKTTR